MTGRPDPDPDRIFVGGTQGEHSLKIALELEHFRAVRLIYDVRCARLGAWIDCGDRSRFLWWGWMSGKTARTVASLLGMVHQGSPRKDEHHFSGI